MWLSTKVRQRDLHHQCCLSVRLYVWLDNKKETSLDRVIPYHLRRQRRCNACWIYDAGQKEVMSRQRMGEWVNPSTPSLSWFWTRTTPFLSFIIPFDDSSHCPPAPMDQNQPFQNVEQVCFRDDTFTCSSGHCHLFFCFPLFIKQTQNSNGWIPGNEVMNQFVQIKLFSTHNHHHSCQRHCHFIALEW